MSALTQSGGPPREHVPYLEQARGKPLPYLFVIDTAGKVVDGGAGPCPMDPDGFLAAIGARSPKGAESLTEVVVDGKPRKLGNRIPPVRSAPKFAYKVYGSTPDTPVLPRAKWKDIDLGYYLPPVYDQDGRGQCNASATCTATEAARSQAGLTPVHLSAGDLYSQINGGSDDGSMLEDGLKAMTESGVASVKSVPYVWDGRRHETAAVRDERKQFVVLEAFLCPTFDHYASAIQSGFHGIHGVLWFDNFTPDGEGWLPGRGRGNYGGHALCGYGLAQRNGVWGVRTRNSWGERWGNSGNCVMPESLFGGNVGGWWAIRATVQTPSDWPPVSAKPANPFDWSRWISKSTGRRTDFDAAFLAP